MTAGRNAFSIFQNRFMPEKNGRKVEEHIIHCSANCEFVLLVALQRDEWQLWPAFECKLLFYSSNYKILMHFTTSTRHENGKNKLCQN